MDELNVSRSDAEIAVLGSLLIDPRCAGLVFSKARREFFFYDDFRALFDGARRLWDAQKPIDPVTVLDAAGFSDKAHVDQVAEIMRVTPTAANVEEYLRILEDTARLRDLRNAAAKILTCSSLEDAAAVYEKIGKSLMRAGNIENVSWAECVCEYLDRMQDPAPPDFLTWGMPKLEDRLHVSLGDFVILGAESSAGKTALALQFAYAQAAAGKSVGFFSLETPRHRLTDRLMAEKQVAGIDLARTKMKNLSPKDFERAADAGIRSDHVPLRIVRNAYSLDEIRREIIISGFQVVYIDYLQLIRFRAASRFEAVTNISMDLHRMASELGVTVIALSQVTNHDKGGKRKAATKDDLRESDQLLQDAEIVMMLNVTSPTTRVLTVEKNKDEGKAVVDLKFDARHMTFGYMPPPKNSGNKPDPNNVSFDDLEDDEGGDLPF